MAEGSGLRRSRPRPRSITALCALCVEQRLRFCFDLDHTLVTAPRVSGDYTTSARSRPNLFDSSSARAVAPLIALADAPSLAAATRHSPHPTSPDRFRLPLSVSSGPAQVQLDPPFAPFPLLFLNWLLTNCSLLPSHSLRLLPRCSSYTPDAASGATLFQRTSPSADNFLTRQVYRRSPAVSTHSPAVSTQ